MISKCLILSYIVVVSCFLESTCSPDANAAEPVWSAQWIGPKTTGSNTWLCFRKTVALKTVPGLVEACIAVDSKYWLWINGKMVIFSGELKRGPTPLNTYYDRVNITHFLKSGKNTIAVLVWYWGKDGFSHNSSGKAGLVFQAKVGNQEIISDDSWKVKNNPAYEQGGPPYPNYRLPEFNVHFDARKALLGWFKCQYDDDNWPKAVSFGIPPVAPWNHLELRPIPQWRNSGLKSYVHVEKVHGKNGEQIIKGFLPYDAQVTPWLEVKSPAGCRIGIKTDDYRGGGPPNVRSVYITRSGRQEFESLGWMNGNWVIYTAPTNVKFVNIKYRETGYNARFVGRFQCNDPALNTLWKKARRTLYVCMRDTYMDCPDRERAQWWGDEVNELGESFYVFDAKRGPLLARNGIRELVRWQRSDNTLYSPVPSGRPVKDIRHDLHNGTWNVELPIQMLAAIGRYGFWTYYQYTGDKSTIELAYPHVSAYLKLWKQGKDGLVIHRKGDWDWEDWGENIDKPILDNAWFDLALQGAIKMAKVCGAKSDVKMWQKRRVALEKNFNKRFWNGHSYRSHDYRGDTDDRANALAVDAGLAKPEQYAALKNVFKHHFNASPYMEKFVIEALYRMHAPNEAMTRMKLRWRNQIRSWTPTLWENWGQGTTNYGGGTYNHAWSGGPLTDLSEFAAGVAPEEPTYQTYEVQPCLGKLKFIRSVVPTPHGDIHLTVTQDLKKVTMKLISPVGTTALAGLPVPAGKHFSKVTANGKMVWKDGAHGRKSASKIFLSAGAEYVRFSLPPGKWRLTGYVDKNETQ